MTNCPNCGAVITGAKCEYCGTVFENETVETTTFYADGAPVLTTKQINAGVIPPKEMRRALCLGVSTKEAAEAFNEFAKVMRGKNDENKI